MLGSTASSPTATSCSGSERLQQQFCGQLRVGSCDSYNNCTALIALTSTTTPQHNEYRAKHGWAGQAHWTALHWCNGSLQPLLDLVFNHAGWQPLV